MAFRVTELRYEGVMPASYLPAQDGRATVVGIPKPKLYLPDGQLYNGS